MARKVDYTKKIEKIKLQLDELSNAINLNQADDNSNEAPVVQKLKHLTLILKRRYSIFIENPI